MTRYVIRPRAVKVRAEWDDDVPMLPSITVDDHEAADTGLISASGEPIYRLPNEMGFHRAGRGCL